MKPIIAICYDFDKTLATNDMQSFSFIPKLGLTENEFWSECESFSKSHSVDPTLSYLRVMINECEKKYVKLTREYLTSLGKDIKYFDGVDTFFKRINDYGNERGVEIEHYIISSGNKEIIEGSSIYKEFKEVYGCEFLYNDIGVAYWPKTIVNYTLKTQFLFRIVKGASDLTDDEKINQRIDKKHVEFRNMIYIGDGLTDVPAMTLVKEKGGIAISIYSKDKQEKSIQLVKDGRVNYACLSDYRDDSELFKILKLIIDSISVKEELLKKEEANQNELVKE